MRTHFLHPGHPKRVLDEVAEVKFGVGEWPREFIICLLDVLKCEFGDVDEAMFQGVESPCEQIFCLLHVAKCDFGEVDKAMFQVVEYPWKSVFRLLPPQNMTWVKSIKRCFKVSMGHANSFSISLASKKQLGRCRISNVLSRRMV
jgi:hypothetical protein